MIDADKAQAAVSAIVATVVMYVGPRVWPAVFSISWQVSMQMLFDLIGDAGYRQLADRAFAFFGKKGSILYVPRRGDDLALRTLPWMPSPIGIAALLTMATAVAYVAWADGLAMLSFLSQMLPTAVAVIVLFAGVRSIVLAHIDDMAIWWIGDTIIVVVALQLAAVAVI